MPGALQLAASGLLQPGFEAGKGANRPIDRAEAECGSRQLHPKLWCVSSRVSAATLKYAKYAKSPSTAAGDRYGQSAP